MKRKKIFISSVQKEFAKERDVLAKYIISDALLGKFFEPFLFEQLPATDKSGQNIYLSEVEKCDIYIGLLGAKYGYEDSEGISPTEREFDHATKYHKTRFVFIADKENREKKETEFINKVQNVLVRKRFSNIAELKTSVYSALVNFLMEKEIIQTAPFDASTNNMATLDNIDNEKIHNFIRLAKVKRGFPLPETAEVETLLTHLNLLRNNKISNAALLLFGKNPQRFFITSEIRCASFYGTKVEKPIPSYKVFKGDVFELVDQAVEFVLNKLDYRIETRKEHVQIPGSYEIPKEIIAEAIVNAVAHRDYTSNASVQVMVFRDRVEIWNPGTLPLGWTTDKLKQLHNSVPANPLLAEPMYLTAYIERLGTGTTDMIEFAKNANIPEPEFIQNDMFRTIVYRKQTEHLTPEVTPEVKRLESRLELRLESRLESRLAAKVLLILKKSELGKSKISSELGHKRISGELNKQIKRLLEQQLIERTIPEKPSSRLQKYRLTSKAINLFEKLELELTRNN